MTRGDLDMMQQTQGLRGGRLAFWLGVFLMGLLVLVAPGLAQPAEQHAARQSRPVVYRLTLDDAIISPITAEYIERGIAEAHQAGAQAVVIELDTPGGLLSSTHTIVKDILNAPLPVIVYVAPAGARAGSAGTFITLSAHVAAMHPSTRIGAAHPVDLNGNWPSEEPDKDGKQPSSQSTMSQKVMNDTIASMRVIAEKRGRNETWAVRAVTESVSMTAEEAVQRKVVDLLAPSLESVLRQSNGRTVQVQERPWTLDLKDASVRAYEFSPRQQVLSILTHPMLSYLLMMLGFYGILFEITHPGVGISGFAGLVCLVLAMIGMQALAINYAGLGLIVVGLILFVVELFTPSFGLLLAGGVICLVLGSLLIYQTGDPFLMSLAPYLVGVAVGLAVLTGLALRVLIKTYRKKPQGVREKLVGQIGKVTQAIDPQQRGKVRVYGEIWSAEADEPLAVGTEIRVMGIHQHDTKVLTIRRHSEDVIELNERGVES